MSQGNRAVTYNRFSPGRKQREESITGQLRENHRLAKEKGLIVIHDYIDRHLTGKTDNRPDFLRMLKDAEKGLFDYVICYQTSRFARNTYDATIYKRKLKKLGVKVIYSKMSIPDGPEGIILEKMLEALDEYYSEELRQKVMRGLYDNALQGKAIGGCVPFGFKLDKNKKYVLDEDKAPILREIFARYASGEKATSISEDLNKRGYRTTKGKEFNKNSFHTMFNNCKYLGIYNYISKDPDMKNVYSEDKIPAIISKDLFEKVKTRVEMNQHRKSKKRLDDICFLLSGKAYDGSCGGTLIGDSGTSKNGNTYYYYTCTNKKRRKGCKTKSVKKDWFENLVVDATREIVLKDDLIEFIGQCIENLQEKNIDNVMLKAAQKELQQTQNSIKNMLKAIEQGIVTDSTKDRLVELESRQAQLEDEVKFEECKINAPKVKKEQVIYWLEQFRNGNIEDEKYKKQIIDTFVNTVILNEETVTIAYNYTNDNIVEIPFSKLKDSPDSVRMSLLNWSLANINRTLKKGSVIDFDIQHHLILFSFKRAA